MKQMNLYLRNALLGVLVLGATPGLAQKQPKTFTATFPTKKDVRVVVNTAHTDVQLETWNKNEVLVEGYIEVEGLSEEEASKIFKSWEFKAEGDSQEVRVTTSPEPSWKVFSGVRMPGEDMDFDFNFDFDFDFEFHDSLMPPMPPFSVLSGDLPMAPMPPMPSMKGLEFDYEAYEKDGEAYMKKWQEGFRKNFDDTYKDQMESWKKNFQEYMKEHQDKIKEWQEQKADIIKQRAEIAKQRAESVAERNKLREEVRKELVKAKVLADSARSRSYALRGFAGKHIKIKRVVKIKMPKDAKLQLNVRHGEVNLAGNYPGMEATFEYAVLRAPVVNGRATSIVATHTPIRVDQWEAGSLRVAYAREVDLGAVRQLYLDALSSSVAIGKISGDARIEGRFGDIQIGNITSDFKHINLNLDNTNLTLVLPREMTWQYRLEGMSTKYALPKGFAPSFATMGGKRVATGIVGKGISPAELLIQSKFSDVVLQ